MQNEQDEVSQLSDEMNPFIGVDDGGNCLPGPYLPLGIARPGPDVVPPNATNGYRTGRPIHRFSQNHVSGTGGGGRYGNVGILPFVGSLQPEPGPFEPDNEEACAGYYRVDLLPADISTELTATHQTAAYRLTYPATGCSNLLLDAGSVVQGGGNPGAECAISIGGYIEVIGDREVIGRADCRGGWGHAFPYSVYFYARFNAPIEQYRLANGSNVFSARQEHDSPHGIACGANSKALLGFGKVSEIEARVGISYCSVANARGAVDEEAGDTGFETIRKRARKRWDEELSYIEVEGGTQEQRELFYTSFARLLCMPSDLGVDHENHLWKSGVRHFTDFYCLWDSVRNANSLLTLIRPDLEKAYLNCILDIASHADGWLPDGWIAGHYAHVRGGGASAANILLREAALKGLEGVDYEQGLAYAVSTAERTSPDPRRFGRPQGHYPQHGYLTTETRQCVSKTVEYSYEDWCIGRLARQLGDDETADRFLERARGVWELWRGDIGCLAPRRPDGAWVDPFDPKNPAVEQRWLDPYCFEGTAYDYTLGLLHYMDELVDKYGGSERFVQHLDWYLRECLKHWNWKEITLHICHLYHYAGYPDRASAAAREMLDKRYAAERSGLSDDEDMGCQSAFYMCTAMGMYPVMGQDVYLLSAPVFQRSSLRLGPEGPLLHIVAPHASPENRYIEHVKLNGTALDRRWLRHGEILDGGELRIGVSESPSGQTCPPPPIE